MILFCTAIDSIRIVSCCAAVKYGFASSGGDYLFAKRDRVKLIVGASLPAVQVSANGIPNAEISSLPCCFP